MVGDTWGGIRGSIWPEFLELDYQLFPKLLLEEPLVSPSASGICLRIFLFLCFFNPKTEGGVGHSEGETRRWHSIARLGCRIARYPSHVHGRCGSVIVILIAAQPRLRNTGVGGAGCHWFADCSCHRWHSCGWSHTVGGVRHTSKAYNLSHRWSGCGSGCSWTCGWECGGCWRGYCRVI